MLLGGGGDAMGLQTREAGGGWAPQETRELIRIRGDMERGGGGGSGSRGGMWEAVSAALSARAGYLRTPEQCKCKWKNLINRYKGKETSDPDNGRQCPFFEELHAVFTERSRNMQRQLLESESGAGASAAAKKKLKRSVGDRSSEEASDDDVGNGEDTEDEQTPRGRKRKPDVRRRQQQQSSERLRGSDSSSTSSIRNMLQGFLQQQQRLDLQWQERMEKRAQERQMFEQEWRQTMEKLERERLMLEQSWMEREEQRKMREEVRAERRDLLLTSLLNKLLQDDVLMQNEFAV